MQINSPGFLSSNTYMNFIIILWHSVNLFKEVSSHFLSLVISIVAIMPSVAIAIDCLLLS